MELSYVRRRVIIFLVIMRLFFWYKTLEVFSMEEKKVKVIKPWPQKWGECFFQCGRKIGLPLRKSNNVVDALGICEDCERDRKPI